jgi:DNA primase
MQIESQSIDNLIKFVDIVDVIGKVTKLRKSGNNYFACCVFHDEKTPSFCINSKDQLYYCFGCGASGNVITFIMEHYGLDFVTAVEKIASDYNYRLEYNKITVDKNQIIEEKKQKLSLSSLMVKVSNFYQKNLEINSQMQNYLFKRGINKDSINNFKLGFAPNNFQALKVIFDDYNLNIGLLTIGVVNKNDAGNYYDRFRNRIIFPIHNLKGEIVAFGGRVIDESSPKYLNSPETFIFNKSKELYGLYQAYKLIKSSNKVIVVEGYIDVIMLHQYGVCNVVATMGTSLNIEHLKILYRICDNIYFCFDGDKAGKNAAWRALENVVNYITDIKSAKFIFLPDNHDPDSFIRQNNKDNFINYIENKALTFSNYLFTKLVQDVDINTEEGKAKFISLIKPYIDCIKAPAMQVMLKAKLSEYVKMTPNIIDSILNNRTRYAFYNSKWQKFNNNLPKINMPIPKFYDILLVINFAIKNMNLLINYKLPDIIDEYSDETKEMIFILDYLIHNYSVDDKINVEELINYPFASNNYPILLTKLQKISNNLPDFDETQFNTTLNKLLNKDNNRGIKIPKIKMKD